MCRNIFDIAGVIGITSVKVPARGNGFQVVSKFSIAVGYMTSMPNQINPFVSNPEVKAMFKKWKKAYDPTSTSAYDMAEMLPKMHNAVFHTTLGGVSKLERVMVWAMVLTSTALLHRGIELTVYCMRIEDLKAGTMSADGLPEYVDGENPATKESGSKPTKFRLYRNRVNPQFCPVLAIYSWVAVCGFETGPLFRRFKKYDGKNKEPMEEDYQALVVDKNKAGVNISFTHRKVPLPMTKKAKAAAAAAAPAAVPADAPADAAAMLLQPPAKPNGVPTR